MIRLACLLSTLLLVAPTAPRGGDDDRAAVERAVTDYVEALYEAKPDLIERSVHPDLVKLGAWRPDGEAEYHAPSKMTYAQLHGLAARWNADGKQGEDLEFSVVVQDVMDITATAKLSALWGVDHMQLMKLEGKWQIVHILWQSHPPELQDAGSAR